MKLTLDIPDGTGAANLVLSFRVGDEFVFDSWAFQPEDGMKLIRGPEVFGKIMIEKANGETINWKGVTTGGKVDRIK